ncbi:MAG: ABC transporter substrate-binding protein [Firmicutes bacterium]|nr:ABC transporter substrate-binding protein [Bacillota bacterium]
MKRVTKIVGTVALFLLLAAFFSGWFGAKDSKEQTSRPAGTAALYKFGKIDIPGKEGSLCAAPIYIAYEKGFYAEEGFEVNLITANTETRKIGLNNGTIPIVNGDFQFFPSIENEVKVKVVDGLHFGCIKLLVPNNSPIYSAKDLRGKRISVDEIGGTPHQVAAVWLEKNGISAKPEDRQVTFLPFSDGNLAVEALNKGEVDVAALWDPFGSVLEKTGNYRVILDIATDEPFADKFCCFLYASEKLIKEEPDKVAALLRAYHKAQNWIAAHPEETVDIIIKGKYSQIEDRELAIKLIKSYAYPTTEDRAVKPTQVRDNVRYFAEQLYSIGYLTTDPETFTNHAYAEIDITLGK